MRRSTSPRVNRVVRGGGWNNNNRSVARARNRNRNDTTNNNVGFRCVSEDVFDPHNG